MILYISKKKDAAKVKITGKILKLILTAFGAKIGKNLTADNLLKIKQKDLRNLVIGDNVYFGPRGTLDIGKSKKVSIGNNVRFTGDYYIASECELKIGDQTIIGEYTSIRDFDHSYNDLSTPIQKQSLSTSPTIIGNDCWIGRGCAILKGAKIERGAIIGANSVVKSNISENSIAAGAPAKIIKKRN